MANAHKSMQSQANASNHELNIKKPKANAGNHSQIPLIMQVMQLNSSNLVKMQVIMH